MVTKENWDRPDGCVACGAQRPVGNFNRPKNLNLSERIVKLLINALTREARALSAGADLS
jgi:hypothetical protein